MLDPHIQRLIDQVDGLCEDRIERNARIKVLEEALKPFAALAAVVDDLGHEDDSTCPHRLKAADIRRARAALPLPRNEEPK